MRLTVHNRRVVSPARGDMRVFVVQTKDSLRGFRKQAIGSVEPVRPVSVMS